MRESEKEKKIFLSYCGSRDQELLTGRKRMTLGDMERFSFLTEFFGLESYGLNLWKEFGDDVEEPLDALIKLLDEWEYENDTWIDDDGRLERWLVEFQKHAPTKEKREKLRKMIDLKYKKRGLPYPTEADFDLKEVMQVEVSIHELLAVAREAVKSDYIKGESILCETRYHPDTHYMVEIEMLKTDNTLGKKGAYIRKFLTEDEYSSMLQKQEEHLIKIKRQAIVQKGTLRYIPLPDRLDSRRKRDIF